MGIKHVMFIYDAISVLGFGHWIQDMEHQKRLEEATKMSDFLENKHINTLYTQMKRFYDLKLNSFFDKFNKVLDQNLPYKTDGLMIVPNQGGYDAWRNEKKVRYSLEQRFKKDKRTPPPGSGLPSLDSRNLKFHPDICKWKPSELQTMDLAIFKTSTGIELKAGNGRELVHFKGSFLDPLSPNPVNLNHHVLTPGGISLNDGTVVEFAYDPIGTYPLVPIQPRYDKRAPNQLDIVIDVWEMAHVPLKEETIRGDGVELMKAYHNDIKRDLYSKIPPNSSILDIGSGPGGDIFKWKKLGRVFAVEPNTDHVKVFKDRLNGSGMENRVTLIETGAEDVEKIINTITPFGKVDVVTFMLSLTFFWRDELLLKNIAHLISKVLKNDGKVIFITMDGDAVHEYFYPSLGARPRKEIKSEAITINIAINMGSATTFIKAWVDSYRGFVGDRRDIGGYRS